MTRLLLIDQEWKPGRIRKNPSSTERRDVEQRQNRQCVFCGQRNYFEIHHVRRVVRGGPTARWNVVAVCRSCHRFIDTLYNRANHTWTGRGLHPATRVAMALTVLGPESTIVAAMCKALFRIFLRSRLDTTRYLSLRPAVPVEYWTPDARSRIAAESRKTVAC